MWNGSREAAGSGEGREGCYAVERTKTQVFSVSIGRKNEETNAGRRVEGGERSERRAVWGSVLAENSIGKMRRSEKSESR